MNRGFVLSSKPCFRIALAVLAFVLLSASSSAAQAAKTSPLPGPVQTDPPYTAYLPTIIRAPDQPKLVSPANGAVLNTLIPTFSWNMGGQPPDTVVCLALGKSPHPDYCVVYIWYNVDYPDLSHTSWYNLDPNTVYYWRVDAVYNDDYDHPNWSAEWSFKTGSRGTILPAPALKTPANNALMPIDQLILTWAPVNGAVEYSVWISPAGESGGYVFFVTSTSLDLRNETDLFTIDAQYEWSVEARNDYAWGRDSTIWKFTVLAASSPLSSSGLAQPTVIFRSPLEGWTGWVVQP